MIGIVKVCETCGGKGYNKDWSGTRVECWPCKGTGEKNARNN